MDSAHHGVSGPTTWCTCSAANVEAKVESVKTMVEATLPQATVRAREAQAPSRDAANTGQSRGSKITSVVVQASPDAVMVTARPATTAAVPTNHTCRRRMACKASTRVTVQARVTKGSGRTVVFHGSHHASRTMPATNRRAGCGRSTNSGTNWRVSSHQTTNPAISEGSRRTKGEAETSASGASSVCTRTKGTSGTLK